MLPSSKNQNGASETDSSPKYVLSFGNACERLSLRTGQKWNLEEKLERKWNVIKDIIMNIGGTLILFLLFNISM